jgi:hypothetical protein
MGKEKAPVLSMRTGAERQDRAASWTLRARRPSTSPEGTTVILDSHAHPRQTHRPHDERLTLQNKKPGGEPPGDSRFSSCLTWLQ